MPPINKQHTDADNAIFTWMVLAVLRHNDPKSQNWTTPSTKWKTENRNASVMRTTTPSQLVKLYLETILDEEIQ